MSFSSIREVPFDSVGDLGRRFAMLKSLIGNDDWWNEVFANRGFIAGGAALFVGDFHQCIEDVGDIDIWCPWIPDTMVLMVHRLMTISPLITMHTGTSMINVRVPKVKLQFIRIDPGLKAPDIIKRFDMTYCQVAIQGNIAASRNQNQVKLELVFTERAESSWTSRIATWVSSDIRSWGRATVTNAHKVRVLDRVVKMARKGFGLSRESAPKKRVHDCYCSHREDTDSDDDEQWDQQRPSSDQIRAVREFDETEYSDVHFLA